MKTEKTGGSVGFRARGKLVPLIETMDKLDMNKSEVFSSILEKHSSEIERYIEQRRRELQEMLKATAA